MLRILLTLAAAAILTADTLSTKAFKVYFLGSNRPTSLRAHLKYIESIGEFQPLLLQKINIKYIELPSFDADIATPLRRIANENPDLVIAVNGGYAFAAKQAFKDTPILFASFDDPIEYGIVASMHARSAPIGGISLADTLEGKRFEILQQAYPKIRRLSIVADRQWADVMGGRRRAEEEARRFGLEVTVALAENRAQVQELLETSAAAQYDAWYIPATPVTDHSADLLIKKLQTWKVPSIWTSRTEVLQGAPMAYFQETDFVWRSLAELTSRIYAGEYAGAIPILRPTRFTLIVRVERESPVPPPDINIVRRADYVIR